MIIFMEQDNTVVAIFLCNIHADCFASMIGYHITRYKAIPKWFERAPRIGKVYRGTAQQQWQPRMQC